MGYLGTLTNTIPPCLPSILNTEEVGMALTPLLPSKEGKGREGKITCIISPKGQRRKQSRSCHSGSTLHSTIPIRSDQISGIQSFPTSSVLECRADPHVPHLQDSKAVVHAQAKRRFLHAARVVLLRGRAQRRLDLLKALIRGSSTSKPFGSSC